MLHSTRRLARTALAALGFVAVIAVFDTAAADPYRWCAIYSGKFGGASNCYFVTLEQCRATVSGVGGYCNTNPRYDGQPIGGEPQRRAKRRS